jgi:hypothetical protein
MRSNRIVVIVVFGGWLLATVVGIAPVHAGPVALPFFEDFQSHAPSADAVADYPAFTPTGAQSRTVDATGVLELGSGPVPAADFFTVTPTGYAAGSELVIKIDMGFDGGAGTGATALRLGNNTILFHPGYNGPPGSFRVEGTGGYGNSDMGFVPGLGVLHHVEVHSFPSGLFNVTITDGANPAHVYMNSFSNLASYGGPIGPAAAGAATAMFDNFTIQAVPEPSSIVMSVAGMAGCCFCEWRRGRRRERH